MEHNDMVPVAEIDEMVLIVRKGSLERLGGPESLGVMAVLVERGRGRIHPPLPLEKHLKFNAWDEIGPERQAEVMEGLIREFSEETLAERVARPLAEAEKQA